MIKTSIPNYTIIEKIGIGGMGVVYKAKDEKLDRIVALKFLPQHMLADSEAEERFISEAKAASLFDHPNICTIYEINKTNDDQLYIAMAYYDGKTLKDEMESTTLSISNAVEYCIQIAKGLERAHEDGITHRDIKPANIMLTNRGEVKILDFGLAKTLNSSDVTTVGTTMGTAAYMSPEQANGSEVDSQSDIWSLGVVFYQMLSGKLPFEGGYEQAIIYSILNEDPKPIKEFNPDCSSRIVTVVEKCLQKEKANRYQTVSEVLEDLELNQIDPDFGFNTKPVKIQSSIIPQKKSKKILFISSIIVVLVGLSFLMPLLWKNIQEVIGNKAKIDQQHLLILPLTNIGGDSDKQAFCDGLMETLSSKLTQIEKFEGSLWVVPASEVLRNKIISPDEANQMYGVNLAVTGSLQFLNNSYRLTLNLVDAINLRQLNSSVIDINAEEISSLQDKSVIKLLEMLHIELDPGLKDIIREGSTTVPEAYEYFVQGRGFLQRYENIENIDAAINSFSNSISSDNSYSLAYASLGESYWRKYEFSKDTEFANRAITECEYAFNLDSLHAPVNVTLGIIYSGMGQYDKAIKHFNYALSKHPSNASAFSGLAKVYELQGRQDDAESTFKRAIKLKSNYWAFHNDLGVFYYNNSRYEDAIEQFKNVIDLTPDNYRGYNNLGGIYYLLERRSEAREMFEKSLTIRESYNIYSNLATLYYIEGKFEEAVQTYEKALKLNDNDYITWANLAAAYNRINDKTHNSIENYKRAIKIAEGQLSVNPNDPEVISNLGAYYADIGNEQKSISLIEQSLVMAPNNVDVHFRAAGAYENLGYRELALYWIEAAIKNGYSRSDIENQYELKELINDLEYKKIVEKLNVKN